MTDIPEPPPPLTPDPPTLREDPRTIERPSLGDIIADAGTSLRLAGQTALDYIDDIDIRRQAGRAIRFGAQLSNLAIFGDIIDAGPVGRNSELSPEYRIQLERERLLREQTLSRGIQIEVIPPIIVPRQIPPPPPPAIPTPPRVPTPPTPPKSGGSNKDKTPPGGKRKCNQTQEPGQCVDVWYLISWSGFGETCTASWGPVGGSGIRRRGPISIEIDPRPQSGPCLSNAGPNEGRARFNPRLLLTSNNAQGNPQTETISGSNRSSSIEFTYDWSIEREDGLDDDCGELVSSCDPPIPLDEPEPPLAPPPEPEPDPDQDPPLDCPDPCPVIPPFPDLDLTPVLEALAIINALLDVSGQVSTSVINCNGDEVQSGTANGQSIAGLYAGLALLGSAVSATGNSSCSTNEPLVAQPESWDYPEKQQNIPQLVVIMKESGEVEGDNRLRSFTIPHWNSGTPTAGDFPTWTRGDWRASVKFPTNARITIFADTQANAESVVMALAAKTEYAGNYSLNISRSVGFITRKYPLAAVGAKWYSQGRKSGTRPDASYKFE